MTARRRSANNAGPSATRKQTDGPVDATCPAASRSSVARSIRSCRSPIGPTRRGYTTRAPTIDLRRTSRLSFDRACDSVRCRAVAIARAPRSTARPSTVAGARHFALERAVELGCSSDAVAFPRAPRGPQARVVRTFVLGLALRSSRVQHSITETIVTDSQLLTVEEASQVIAVCSKDDPTRDRTRSPRVRARRTRDPDQRRGLSVHERRSQKPAPISNRRPW